MTDNTIFTNPNGFSLMRFVPRIIRRRAAGALLFGLGVFLFGSFLDHAALDPSWNTASSQTATNIFGSAGSHVSDVGLQLFGWGGYGLALSFLVWGSAYLLRPLRFKMYSRGQVFVALGSSFLFSITASSLPVPIAWPFSNGLGSLFGDLVFLPTQGFLGGPFGGAALGALCFILAILGFIWAFSLQRSDAARIIDAAYELVQKAMFLVRGFGKNQPKPAARKKVATKPKRRKSKAKVAPVARARAGTRAEREKQLKMPFVAAADFELPHLELLAEPTIRTQSIDEAGLRQNAELLETVLMDFGIKGQIVHVQPGPVVTLYELEPAPGLKSSRVISLSDDIARSMSAIACRVAVIPGRNVIGIELPNSRRETVFLRDTLSSVQFEKSKALLPLALGESISGEPYIADLARMPHMLIAGTTGSVSLSGLMR